MKVGILAIHGMGTDPFKYNRFLKKALEGMEVVIEPVDYHQYTQTNQDKFLQRMSDSELGWGLLRRYLINYLSDGLNVIRQPKETGGMFDKMNDSIDEAYKRLESQLNLGDKLIVVAHSLGAMVFGAYLYEHCDDNSPFRAINLPNIDAVITTGSPIAMFFSCMREQDIKIPELVKRDVKKWYNFYDKDDVLSWPLQPLSPDFNDCVQDVRINVGTTPLAHSLYWMNDSFQKHLQVIVKDLGGTHEH